jgi:PilZ domain
MPFLAYIYPATMVSAEPTRIERRCGHRFSQYQVPVLLQTPEGATGTGFTLDLSSRGALLWTDFPLTPGQSVDVTLIMPSEITLGEDMCVRCRTQVLRLEPDHARSKPAVAVRIEHYDFIPRELAPFHQHPAGEAHHSRA